MEQLFSIILKTSLSGAVVIGAIACLRPILKKAPGNVLCLLWFLAVLRLLLPFEIPSPLSLQPEPERISQVIPALAQSAPVVGEVADAAPSVLPFLWFGISLLLAVLSIRSYRKLKGQVREAWRTEDGCWEASGIDTAFVLGFLRPRIYMPSRLGAQDHKFVLCHERWHIRLLHHLLKPLGYLALCLHWFNPVVWMGYRMMCADLETACDEQVIRDLDVQQRKDYSETLLNFCAPKNHFGYSVAFGGSDPKRRILSVLHYKKPGFWITLTGIVAMVFVVGCLMTSPRASADTLPEDRVPIVCMTAGCTEPGHDHAGRDCTAANCGVADHHHTFCGDESCSICLARLEAQVKEFADCVDSLEQEFLVKYGYLYQNCTDPDHDHSGGYCIITQGCEEDYIHAGCTDENCEICKVQTESQIAAYEEQEKQLREEIQQAQQRRNCLELGCGEQNHDCGNCGCTNPDCPHFDYHTGAECTDDNCSQPHQDNDRCETPPCETQSQQCQDSHSHKGHHH